MIQDNDEYINKTEQYFNNLNFYKTPIKQYEKVKNLLGIIINETK